MNKLIQRILNNLQRPWPDLLAYLQAKATSFLWKQSLKSVGRHFHVSKGALIQGGCCITIGNDFYAGQLLWIEAVRKYASISYHPTISIGNDVSCSQSVHIAANRRVTIGDGVMLGSRIHITDHGHGSYHGKEQSTPDTPPAHRTLSPGRPVVIERNVWLGDGVVVLPGVTIGEGSIVGANSVVSRDLPAHIIAVGTPATPIKRFDSASGCWVAITDPS